MTDLLPGELAIWRDVYADAWMHPAGGGPGAVSDHERATWAASQASRAVRALRMVESDDAAEARR